MRKFILFFCSLFFLSESYSQEETLLTMLGSHYNDSLQSMTPCSFQFKYNVKKDIVYFMVLEDSVSIGYLFTKENRDSIKTMIDKYLSWEKKAVNMNVEVDKGINQIHLTGYFNYANSKKIHKNGYALLKTYFLSQDIDWHQLVLKFGTIEDRKNRFKNYKPKNIYLDKNQVLEFQKVFDPSYIDSFRKNLEKQRNIKKLFK